MRIAITGASGLVGRHLVPFLEAGGHDVVRLVRDRSGQQRTIFWDPATGEIDTAGLEGTGAIVHLAGESIAGGRWTKRRKTAILDSRVDGTTLLASAVAKLERPPTAFVSVSAVGYYGNAGDVALTESSPAGAGFLADVCRAWEAAATPAAEAGVRVVHPRFGIVMAGDGGLLPTIGRAFRFGLGGRLGSGDQYMSWIAIDDLVRALHACVADARLSGPVNAVSPSPVTNREFTQTLGRVLGRPTVMNVPAGVLRLVAGDLADDLLLASQRVEPKALGTTGFVFQLPDLESTLRQALGKVNGPQTSADAAHA